MTYPDYWILMHRIADQLTPMALRKGVWRALTQALLSPVATLAADGRSFIVDKRRRMEHNGQVRLLERICNILMLGEYDISDPLIYLDEPAPVNEFLVSPDGRWEPQGSIHYDPDGKDAWDLANDDPLEAPEQYSILHDRSGHVAGLGFIVHIRWPLNADNPAPAMLRAVFRERGGEPALCRVVDTYKLAGKRYIIVWDEA